MTLDEALDQLHQAIDDLRREIEDGFKAVRELLAEFDATLPGGGDES